jgi:predicted DNA-binding protein (MmcQ/YjbR family)
MPRRRSLSELAETLRAHALTFPGAWEDHPWEETVVKVGKKIFVFLGMAPEEREHGDYAFCVKLPESADQALELPGAEPAGYGLGKAGWVLLRMKSAEDAPVDVFCDWIDESYRTVAPRRLVAELDARYQPEAEAE